MTMIFRDEEAEERLRNYAGFYINLDLLSLTHNFFVFGGAVRDALTGKNQCKDLDILFDKEPCDEIINYLKLTHRYIGSMYMVRELDGKKFGFDSKKCYVDVMWPIKYPKTTNEFLAYFAEVDLTSSGIAYNPSCGFIQILPGALDQILRKEFAIREDAKGYHKEKSQKRADKLIQEGWKCTRKCSEILF